jgi:glyoxylase-like metal-dependent hydrolase (beta-lactamase superfamily II)
MRQPIAVVLLAACSSSPTAPPASPPATTGRAERFTIGDLEAYVLEDGHLILPNDGQSFGVGRSTDETGDLLASAGLPRDAIRLDIQCLLVKAGDRVILFDTGAGNAPYADAGRLPRSLALAGVDPAAVTDVFLSHAHGDHIGGVVTAAGVLAFPAATIHLSAPEWTAAQAEAQASADDRRLIAAMTPKVAPFEPGAQVLPVVQAIATPGHTPGHSSYRIGTGADALFYSGDLVHHAVISVQRPAWSIQYDHDRAAAEALRQATLARLAADGTRVFAFHFPFPGVGHVVASGDGFRWNPEPR